MSDDTNRSHSSTDSSPLPITAVLPELLAVLQDARIAVVIAPPGSGKTTGVPPALLDADMGPVALLQPRRAAARLIARHLARQRGGKPGGEVGYRIRFENKTSAATRLTVLTEGLLTRILQSDPFLEDFGTVVLDEFHERSLHADLALGMLTEVMAARDDLRVIVMSATLDPGPLVAFFGGNCPVIRAEGRRFPVDIRHAPRTDDRHIEVRCASAIRALFDPTGDGHILAFLPGVGEIARTAEHLEGLPVWPLHGRLSGADQDAALAPSKTPKIVLATNIAETSVTLPGVVAVVDSGLQRRPRFDPALGTTRLETVHIPASSAEQRAGRAGRTRPGQCQRLWTARQPLQPFDPPEILRADLTRTVLEVYAWGSNPRTFPWLTPPPEALVAQAESLLTMLAAINDRGITPHGRALMSLPVHPRLAAVVLAGQSRGCLRAAATAAALASERDPWPRDPVDLIDRIDRVTRRGSGGDRRALSAVRQVRDQLIGLARGRTTDTSGSEVSRILRALIAGFPDRVARQRSDPTRYQLASGRGARLDPSLPPTPFLVAVTMTARRGEPIIRVAAAVEADWLTTTPRTVCDFDPDRKAVVEAVEQVYGALVLHRAPSQTISDPARASVMLAEAAAADPERALTVTPAVQTWLARLRWLSDALPDLKLPDLDLSVLVADWSVGRSSFSQLRKLDLLASLKERLTWPQQETLRREAPTHYTLPTGKRVSLRYEGPGVAPVLAARIQQLFGLEATPRIARGTVALQVHLLAPNNRPAQVTADLAGFWRGSYAEVRRELRGRYPRHSWPEDPVGAKAEDRPRRRR
ncbi:MAG: ATP-dependent helicase HrpB [Myxococcota bacterium]|jgi:ATP-dependent helicase HrpB